MPYYIFKVCFLQSQTTSQLRPILRARLIMIDKKKAVIAFTKIYYSQSFFIIYVMPQYKIQSNCLAGEQKRFLLPIDETLCNLLSCYFFQHHKKFINLQHQTKVANDSHKKSKICNRNLIKLEMISSLNYHLLSIFKPMVTKNLFHIMQHQ